MWCRANYCMLSLACMLTIACEFGNNGGSAASRYDIGLPWWMARDYVMFQFVSGRVKDSLIQGFSEHVHMKVPKLQAIAWIVAPFGKMILFFWLTTSHYRCYSWDILKLISSTCRRIAMAPNITGWDSSMIGWHWWSFVGVSKCPETSLQVAYGHHPCSINFYVPLTPISKTSSLFLATWQCEAIGFYKPAWWWIGYNSKWPLEHWSLMIHYLIEMDGFEILAWYSERKDTSRYP